MGMIEQGITRFPFLRSLAQVMPFADLAFGGMLLVVMFMHATGEKGQ